MDSSASSSSSSSSPSRTTSLWSRGLNKALCMFSAYLSIADQSGEETNCGGAEAAMLEDVSAPRTMHGNRIAKINTLATAEEELISFSPIGMLPQAIQEELSSTVIVWLLGGASGLLLLRYRYLPLCFQNLRSLSFMNKPKPKASRGGSPGKSLRLLWDHWSYRQSIWKELLRPSTAVRVVRELRSNYLQLKHHHDLSLSITKMNKDFFKTTCGVGLIHQLLEDSVKWTSIDHFREYNPHLFFAESAKSLSQKRLFNPAIISVRLASTRVVNNAHHNDERGHPLPETSNNSHSNALPSTATLHQSMSILKYDFFEEKQCKDAVRKWQSTFSTHSLDFTRIRSVFLSLEFDNKQVIVLETANALIVCFDESTRTFSNKTMRDFVFKLSNEEIDLNDWETTYRNTTTAARRVIVDQLRTRLSDYLSLGEDESVAAAEQDINDAVDSLSHQDASQSADPKEESFLQSFFAKTLRSRKTTNENVGSRNLLFYHMRLNRLQTADPSFFILENGEDFRVSFKVSTSEGTYIMGTDKLRTFAQLLPTYEDPGKYLFLKALRDLGFAEEAILANLFKTLGKSRCYLILQTGVISVKDLVLFLKTISTESGQKQCFFVVDPDQSTTHIDVLSGKEVVLGTYTAPGPANYLVHVGCGLAIEYVVGDMTKHFSENGFHLTSTRLIGGEFGP